MAFHLRFAEPRPPFAELEPYVPALRRARWRRWWRAFWRELSYGNAPPQVALVALGGFITALVWLIGH